MLPGNSVFLVSIECLVQGQATKRTQSLGFLPLKYYKNIKNKLNFFFKKNIYIYFKRKNKPYKGLEQATGLLVLRAYLFLHLKSSFKKIKLNLIFYLLQINFFYIFRLF
jgi:hypothetical protein